MHVMKEFGLISVFSSFIQYRINLQFSYYNIDCNQELIMISQL